MCGIVGYSGRNKTISILIEKLKRLEYRGYDSAGIAIISNGVLVTKKKPRKVSELEKEQASSFHSDALFVQNLKNQIKSVEETLNKLLDAHLDSTITSEEYIGKKQKLLNQKIDFSEKLKDFERKGNRWLELSKQFILDSNQAVIIASEENLEARRDFLKKIGSNPRLASRSLLFHFKNPWRILSETPVASLCDAPHFGENGDPIFWLRD